MTASTIRVMGADYPGTRGMSGTYAGLDIAYDACGTEIAFGTILRGQPFQANEFSLSNYTMMRDRGATHLAAIPVFLNRAFRHGVAWTREASPLSTLRELAGKRVGIKEYSQTAAVWFRGLLADEYGVDWRDIEWIVPRRQRFAPPAEARVTNTDDDLERLALEGAIDAYVAPRVASTALRPVLREHVAAEAEYERRTGIVPINHTVVIERGVLAAQPSVARAVFDAYRTGRLAANDPGRHGLDARNRKNVETLFRHLHEQRLVGSLPTVAGLFELREVVDA